MDSSRLETQKPGNLPLGLPDLYARDGACNDQTLNFRSPLEDRVSIGVAHKSPSHRSFLKYVDPHKSEFDPVWTDLDPVSDPVSGSRPINIVSHALSYRSPVKLLTLRFVHLHVRNIPKLERNLFSAL